MTPAAIAALQPLRDILRPIGATVFQSSEYGPGADIDPLVDGGVPGIGLIQDGRKYFDYHHSAADTLDKVDPQELRENAAAMAVMGYALAAMPDALQDFRISRLKTFGCNAYRCSHNPPTPELLDACDRLGMVVVDENRLMGTSEDQLDHLKRLILRDRNHPSVILWSVGNEEWRIEGNITGARIASTMQSVAKHLDPTRRVTVAISGGWGWGISTVVDVMGYNYITGKSTDNQHAQFPNQPGVGTEETTTQGTRGVYFDDQANAHMAPLEHGDSGGNCEIGWKHYAARPYLAGLFYWTGFDYRGEETPFSYPAIICQYGILDICGFPKDSFYYLKAWWMDEPMVHLALTLCS